MQLLRPLMFPVTVLLMLYASGVLAQDGKCVLSGGSLAFGPYNPGFTNHLDATGTVTLQCSGTVRGQLGMSVGNGAGASYASGRVMTGGTSGSLRYNLFVDAARTQVLGDGTGGSTHMNLTIRGTLTQAFWGRIPAGQSTVTTGFYSDTLIATISY